MFRMKLMLVVTSVLLFTTAEMISGRPEGRGGGPPAIPKVWEDQRMASFQVPLAEPAASPVHASSDFYYRIPIHKIYKSYPIYAPGKEPPGYFESLMQKEPEVIEFDPSKFKTQEDWIKAGEMIFDEPMFYNSLPTLTDVRNPEYYEKFRVPLKDGVLPFTRYVIRKKGKVDVGALSCAICHTRVLPDGTVIKGAQGNFPFDQTEGHGIRWKAEKAKDKEKNYQKVLAFQRGLFATPWLRPDPHERINSMSLEELAQAHEAIPPGVIARQGSSLFYPVVVPDLIGVKDIRYLDRTGLVLHNSIGDLMRYAALAQPGDDLARFGDFFALQPLEGNYPEPTDMERFSDEQLYALALFIYSLKPPPNPNKFDATAARGQKVFAREGCATCHTPPLYTNNKLTPVDGFKPPQEHLKRFGILPGSVGTDPDLTLKTRRGTGYYKVPSLRGVWYRGPFEHSGSVATLEDWFDPNRLKDDYVPTGFRGVKVEKRAVKGHRYGLNLSAADRKALIAFLRTL
jgi:hypothetical protein